MITIMRKKKKGLKRTESLLASLDGVPSSNKDKRGIDAEKKAYLAARHWKNKKIIRNVRVTDRLGQEDMEMKDLVITLLSGEEIFVQIKNYCSYLDLQKCRQENIRLLVLWPDEGDDIAKEKMLDLIVSAHLLNVGHLSIRRILRELTREQRAANSDRPNPVRRFFSFFAGIRGVFL